MAGAVANPAPPMVWTISTRRASTPGTPRPHLANAPCRRDRRCRDDPPLCGAAGLLPQWARYPRRHCGRARIGRPLCVPTFACCSCTAQRSNPWRHLGEQLSAASQRPGLVLLATDDYGTGTDTARRRAAQRTGTQVAVLAGLGHWWMLEDPTGTASVLRQFWSPQASTTTGTGPKKLTLDSVRGWSDCVSEELASDFEGNLSQTPAR